MHNLLTEMEISSKIFYMKFRLIDRSKSAIKQCVVESVEIMQLVITGEDITDEVVETGEQ